MADKNNEVIGPEELSIYDALIKHYVDNKVNNNSSDEIRLDNLTDINITSLQDGNILKYNANTSKWENATESNEITSISTNSLPHTSWSSGSEGELRYELQSDDSKHLYEYKNGAWNRVYDVTMTVQGSSTINTPFNKIIVSTTDIGEGQPLDAGTIVLVVE